MAQAIEIPSQRLMRAAPSTEEIKLRPGQYLIRTPDNFTEERVGRKVVKVPIPYNGTAYGIEFRNNIAVIDDVTVAQLREVMLDELEGDENRLAPWWRAGKAADLARALASDFGYVVVPELPKLKRLTKAQIYATSNPDIESGDLADAMAPRAPGDAPGQDTERRQAPVSGRRLSGVDYRGNAEASEVEGMPEQPPEAKPRGTPTRARRK